MEEYSYKVPPMVMINKSWFALFSSHPGFSPDFNSWMYRNMMPLNDAFSVTTQYL